MGGRRAWRFPDCRRPLPTSALALAALSCGLMLQAAGYPPEAARKTPPPGIDARALAVGAAFPTVALEGTEGPASLEKDRRHVLVFYRGSW